MLKINPKTLLQISLIISAQITFQSFNFSLIAEENSPLNRKQNCRPEIDQNQNIIGYGSLMQEESRLLSAPKAKIAYPVIVQG